MKLLVRVLAVLAVLLVLGLVSLVFYAPRLIERPEVKERIVAAARDATGRDLRYDQTAWLAYLSGPTKPFG